MLLAEREALREYLASREHTSNVYVFTSQKVGLGKPLHRSTLDDLFKAVCENADIPASKRFCHVLKHTLAMTLLAAGQNAFMIQKALGHASIQSTLAYTKPTDGMASSAIANAFKGLQ